MQHTDHYAVLGIAPTSTLAEIRYAYRQVALRAHPDKGGNTEWMRAVSDAWEVLSHSESRQAFDILYFSGWLNHRDTPGTAPADALLLPSSGPILSRLLRENHAVSRSQYAISPLPHPEEPIEIELLLGDFIEKLPGRVYDPSIHQTDSTLFYTPTSLVSYKEAQKQPPAHLHKTALNLPLSVEQLSIFLLSYCEGELWGAALDAVRQCIANDSNRDSDFVLLKRTVRDFMSREEPLLFAWENFTRYLLQHPEHVPYFYPVIENPFFRNAYLYAWETYCERLDRNCLPQLGIGYTTAQQHWQEMLTASEEMLPRWIHEPDFREAWGMQLTAAKIAYLFEKSFQKLRRSVHYRQACSQIDDNSRQPNETLASFFSDLGYRLCDWLPALAATAPARMVQTQANLASCWFWAAYFSSDAPSAMAFEKMAIESSIATWDLALRYLPPLDKNSLALTLLTYLQNLQYAHPQLQRLCGELAEHAWHIADFYPFYRPLERITEDTLKNPRALGMLRSVWHTGVAYFTQKIPSDHSAARRLEEAFEASLAHWYDAQYDPHHTESLRIALLDAALKQAEMGPEDIVKLLAPSSVFDDKDAAGWMQFPGENRMTVLQHWIRLIEKRLGTRATMDDPNTPFARA